MILTVDGWDYVAHFYHDFKLRETYCRIHNGSCWLHEDRPCSKDTTLKGWSRCSLADQFVKRKGRKLAFARAVHNLPRDARAKFWEAYWKVQVRK